MSNDLFLGVDIGTSMIKGALIDTNGEITEQCQIPHEDISPKIGWHEHNPDIHWWGSFKTVVSELFKNRKSINQLSGISVTGIWPTFCPADQDGIPLYNAILYDDCRALEIALSIKEHLGSDFYGNELIPKILWLRKELPAIWERTRKIFTAHSYLVYKLTGSYCLDGQMANKWGGIFNSESFQWNERKLLEFNIPPELLPPVYPPSAIAGYVKKEITETIGIPYGIPVTVGAGDMFMSLLGSGAHLPGDCLLNYSSVGVLAQLTQNIEYVFDSKHYNNGDCGFENVMILSQFGKHLEWIINLFTKNDAKLEDFDKPVMDKTSDETLPLFIWNTGSNQGRTAMTFVPSSTIHGLTMEHDFLDVYISVLETFGFEVLSAIEKRANVRRIFANGGGAKNEVWKQIVCDITNKQQIYLPNGHGAYGAAILAAYATKTSSIEDLLSFSINQAKITSPLETCRYNLRYKKYIQIKNVLKPTVRQ